MSSKTASKHTDAPVKKKRSSKKAKPSTAGKQASAATKKKKSASKKTTGKKAGTRKAAARKAVPRKALRKAGSRKGSMSSKATPAATSAATDTEGKSLSWMSARANSALKAVKASQAEKGQAVLAKTKKQQTRDVLDDDQLIEIAASMPVDNEALMHYTSEEPMEASPTSQETANVPDKTLEVDPVTDATIAATEPAAASNAAAGDGADQAPAAVTEVEVATTTPAARQPAPPPAARQPSPWPARVGVLLVVLVLAYLFWPADSDLLKAIADRTHGTANGTAHNDTAQIDVREDTDQGQSLVDDSTAVPAITAVAAPPAGNKEPAALTGNSPAVTSAPVTAWQPSRLPPPAETAPATGAAVQAEPTAPVETTPASGITAADEAIAANPPAASPAAPAEPAVTTAPPATAPPPAYQRPAYGYYPPGAGQQRGYQQRPYYYR